MLDTGDGNYLEFFEHDPTQSTVGEAGFLPLLLRCDDGKSATQIAREATAKVETGPFSPENFQKIGLNAKIAFIYRPDGEIIGFFECAQL